VLLRGELTPRLCTLVRPGEVEQVLFNLIRNALEGFRRGSREGEKTVSLVLHGTEEAVVVDVIDNAGGVPEQAAGKLFQINPASTGTGLGLYISRSLAERSGGTLVYEPRPGGSCFRLTLPVAKPEAGEKGHPGQE
jgi:signal transduction histidine kinase